MPLKIQSKQFSFYKNISQYFEIPSPSFTAQLYLVVISVRRSSQEIQFAYNFHSKSPRQYHRRSIHRSFIEHRNVYFMGYDGDYDGEFLPVV